jgi:RNA recognition motif-containing protein
LRAYFSTFGEVKSIKINTSGTALISFADRDSAKKAKDMAQGQLFDGRYL